jgi:hypothetical protein
MEAVQGTHLYGRRLVLEWAEEEGGLDELRAKTGESAALGPQAGASHGGSARARGCGLGKAGTAGRCRPAELRSLPPPPSWLVGRPLRLQARHDGHGHLLSCPLHCDRVPNCTHVPALAAAKYRGEAALDGAAEPEQERPKKKQRK